MFYCMLMYYKKNEKFSAFCTDCIRAFDTFFLIEVLRKLFGFVLNGVFSKSF